MLDSSIYAVFERMWQHVLAKCNNYVPIEALDSHIEDIDNPHQVTAEQIGVYTKEEIDNQLTLLNMLTYIDDEGVLCFNVVKPTNITSYIDYLGNVTTDDLTSTYNDGNVSIYGFSSYLYTNENMIIV